MLEMSCDKAEDVSKRFLLVFAPNQGHNPGGNCLATAQPEKKKKNSPWAPRFGGQTRPREANVGNAAPTWPNLQSTDPGAAEYSWRFYSSAAGWWFEVGPKNTTWWVVEPPLWTIWKSIWMIIPNIWKKEMLQTTNQQSNTLAKICGGNTLPSDLHRVQPLRMWIWVFGCSARGDPKLSGCFPW